MNLEKCPRVFTSLVNLSIADENLTIDSAIYLTTDYKIKDQVVSESRYAIGELEYFSIAQTHPVLAYAFIGYNVSDKNRKDVLHEILYPVQVFCFSLWIVKDNSVYPQMCYLNYITNMYSDIQAQFNSNCQGESEEIKFSAEEMMLAIGYYQKLMKHSFSDKISPLTVLTSNTNRLSRFMLHLSAARLHEDIAFKYGFYYNALEALLVTHVPKRQRNAHRIIAVRIALILNQDANYVESYINAAKEHRNTVFHGQTFKDSVISKRKKILDGLDRLDGICRHLFQKILIDESLECKFLLEDDEFERYFIDLVQSQVS